MTLEMGVKELAEAVGADVKALDDGKVDKESGYSLVGEAEIAKLATVQENATKNRPDSENADKIHGHVIADVTGLDTTLAGKVDKVAGKGLSDTNFTQAEKTKLSSLEDSKFVGLFVSESTLPATGSAGDYANVDGGVGSDVYRVIWDTSDNKWVRIKGVSTELTPAQIKQQYEVNPDTNAYTDEEKAKLSGIATGATKNRSDSENADKIHTHTLAQITEVNELMEAVGADVEALNLKIGDISQLQTAAKSNLVDAINEAATSGGGGGANDATLRSDLANPDKGAAMVARGVVAVDSIADLLSLPEEYRRDDLRYSVKSYHPPQDYLDQPYSGGGLFSYDPERSLENDGGMILDGFVRDISERHPTIGPEFFGARYDLDETLVPVDYMSDAPKGRVRITSQTFEAECVNKCIRWARARPDLLVNVKISGFIKVYAYLEPLDLDIKISGSSPQTSGLQSMDTSPTNAEGYGIIVCGKPQGTGSNFVWIENIKLDGRGSFRLKPDRERRVYNLVTYTGSNLYAHNIESVDSPIDCLNVSGETAYVVKSIFKKCYRNTITAGSVSKWAKFIDCEISEAGYVHGGTNPRYCVDVEPNLATLPAELVEFIRCKISKSVNSLVGAVWSTTVWDDCVFDGSERALEAQSEAFPWLGTWAQGNHLITGCQFIGNSERGNTVHGYNVNHENSDLGYDSRLVFKDNLFKGCGMRLFGFNIEVIGNRIENSTKGIQAVRPNNIDVQRFVIRDNYLYNVIPTAKGELAAIQVQATVVGEVLVEGNTVVFDRNELEWVDGVILEQLKLIQAFQVNKPSSGTASGTRIILNNTAINYYKEYIEGLIPLTETAIVKGWTGSIADSPAESWPPMPNDPAFYRGNL